MIDHHIPNDSVPEDDEILGTTSLNADGAGQANTAAGHDQTVVEDTIHSRLANFFEKRRASGDARPCGPYDMGPVYKTGFGISTSDLQDERFLGRLKRQGLGTEVSNSGAASKKDSPKKPTKWTKNK